MNSRRKTLATANAQHTTHAGLWLDRFIRTLRDRTQSEGGAGQKHLQELCDQIKAPADEYQRHYQRWQKRLEATPDTLTAMAHVRGRMVVGLGTESVLETAIMLHRTYGVPVIPGSALKGLASTAAHRFLEDPAWRRQVPAGDGATHEPNNHGIVFGTTQSAGYLTFHDALWSPEGSDMPLDLDVMTVHHREYYSGENKPAADWDNPTPVPFVTARGSYLVAVTGPRKWADAAMRILKDALEMDGIGAKTAAGYGRMTLAYESAEERVAQARAAEAPELMKQAKLLKRGNAAQEVPRLLDKVDRAARAALAEEIVRVLKQKWLRERQNQPWVSRLLEAAGIDL